jgi:hypothetical protein
VLETAARPLDSLTWRAAVRVVLARTQGDPAGIGRLGYPRFALQVTRQLARWGGRRRCQRIVRAVWTAATSPQALALGSTPSGLAPWNAPAWSWTTGTMAWTGSPRSSGA